MSHYDARSAVRPQPDQPMVDIADYVVDYRIESQEAYDTARYMLLDSLACAMLAMKFYGCVKHLGPIVPRSEEQTSELQSLIRISYTAFFLKKKKVIT